MLILKIMLVWFAISIVTSLVIGRFLAWSDSCLEDTCPGEIELTDSIATRSRAGAHA